MSASFFRGTEPQLYHGTRVFSAAISLSPETYGLTAADVDAYRTLSDAFCSAYEAVCNPATRTKSRVAAKNDAMAALRAAASRLSKHISSHPTVSSEQKLALGLNVRKKRAPLPPPGKPYDFRADLNGKGGVTATWKCDSPRRGEGVIYYIFRRIGPTGPFKFLFGVGRRKFTDDTIPSGTAQVTYRIHGSRSTGPGPTEEFPISFGVHANSPQPAPDPALRIVA